MFAAAPHRSNNHTAKHISAGSLNWLMLMELLLLDREECGRVGGGTRAPLEENRHAESPLLPTTLGTRSGMATIAADVLRIPFQNQAGCSQHLVGGTVTLGA